MSAKNDRSAEDIRRSAERMKRARSEPGVSPLRGLGAFGIIGWSIAVPTVGGAFLGLWLNKVAPQNFSWPIALILGGVVVGGIIAWNWIDKEGPDQKGDKR
ncbi:MAG: AtpZ/AtpI family protein [Marinobacter sp.]|uniref:AtpZ/AtpI family protein n=1 Tax=Marinobacter sp. TaxID=50741 RepID=UPI001B60AB4E|nr:AtpZ/AtpI family protein [Marinobacter sp.]MBQ0745990.1 AtpZ/AtpI family protein [Marinobacter sp.]MBQ0814483.1 AtpZ/AtpI family protein [Marinobacter sp.]|tara:strand:- start:4505 stop:4807 length:303 start_codon:yes stop_codon:yes gene_type:complete